MRFLPVWALGSLALATIGLVACATADDGTEDGSQDLSGGDNSVEPSTVYFFATRDATSTRCVGATLADRIAVTAKDCARQGMFVGRATDDSGDGVRATITAVHVPDGADADIAIVELDRPLAGTHAVITHVPLRDGYSINSVSSSDNGENFFAPRKGDPSSVKGRMISETDTQSLLVPGKGAQICAGDLGAPVCSSSSTNVDSFSVKGTCGLSGVVVGAADAVFTGPVDGGAPALDAGAQARCSAGSWKVAQLGHHADFIRKFAPQAFQPLKIQEFFFISSQFVPEGLWGFKTAGDVKACQIQTATLAATPVNGQVQLSAKVSFANMQQNAVAFGRFGIALKTAPTQMRWLPAKGTVGQNGGRGTFDVTFDGAVSADKDGEYIVGFRASANGGETWTSCDLDGMANGFSADKLLPFKVGTGVTPATPTTPGTTPPATAPASAPPPSNLSDPPPSDPPPSDPSSDPSTDPSAPAADKAAKPKKKAGGCSTTPAGERSPALPALGLVLGLAALVRRRRS